MVHLTYVTSSRGNHSAIHLTICNPTVYMDFTWKVHDDTGGDDHFLIQIKSSQPSSKKVPSWKLDKVNWEIFKGKSKNKPTHIETNHDIVEHFTETQIEIAKDCVPRKSTPNATDPGLTMNAKRLSDCEERLSRSFKKSQPPPI